MVKKNRKKFKPGYNIKEKRHYIYKKRNSEHKLREITNKTIEKTKSKS